VTMEHQKATSPSTTRIPGFVLLCGFLAFGWYYIWNPSTRGAPRLLSEPTGLYHELTDAFLSGRVSLASGPNKELLLLPDPYDPKANLKWRRNDVSYFDGRYYLYHSPIPVLVLFLPIKIATGRYLAEDLAGEIFGLIGIAAGLGCLLSLRNICFPRTPLGLLLLCGCALGFCGGQFAVLREATINHVAVACASAFLMLAFFAALQFVQSRGHATAWLAAASVCQTLAAFSRPDLLFGSIGLLALLLPPLKSKFGEQVRATYAVSLVVAIVLPMLVIGGIAGIYNFERFGTPFEFGARLMLGGWDQRHMSLFSVRGSTENAWYYFLAPANYHRYFPFVTAPTWRSIGIIPNLPFLIFPFLLLLPSIRKPAGFTLYAATVLVFNTLSLLLLPSGNEAAVVTSANMRYLPDIASVAALLGCIGVMAIWERVGGAPLARRLLIAGIAAVTLWSVLAGISLDFQRFPSSSYRSLAQFLNEPTALWEKASGQRYGPLVVSVRFPSGLTGKTDPLVLTGERGAADLIYVNYLGDSAISFGLASDGIVGPHGDALSLNYKVPHRIEVWMGSLYPPIGHPAFAAFTSDDVTIATRTVRVEIDGQVALNDVALCHSANANEVRLGADSYGLLDTPGDFRGSILGTQRLPLSVADLREVPPLFGQLSLLVRLPKDRVGESEPLVTTGEPAAGDFVFLTYLPGNRIQLGYDHWGHSLIRSEPIPLDFGVPHRISISMGSLNQRGSSKVGLAVTLDDLPVLSSTLNPYASSAYEVAIGRNPIGGSSCGYMFTGQIIAESRGNAR